MWQARRSLGRGLVTVLFWGYTYGIVRANLLSTASYFIFDCSLAGLYLACLGQLLNSRSKRLSAIRTWTLVLIGWPLIVCFFPFQDFLVSLVGLRGNVFFLPMMLVGASLVDKDLRELGKGMASLNILSFGFGLAEYFLGVTRFYPPNAVTRIIYASNDVAGYTAHRIPAIFVTAHAYGGSMVMSLPLLLGLWAHGSGSAKSKLLVLIGIITAFVGILLSATRQNFVLGSLVVLSLLLGGSIPFKKKLLMIIALVGVGLLAANNERMGGRLKSLGDSHGVSERIGGSVNRGFWDVINEYPMGNGLGGGGTSIPAFLIDRVRHCTTLENEYGRIALEQGLPGLALWIGFLLWFLVSSAAFVKTPWQTGRRVSWACCVVQFASAGIGVGLFTSIPGTLMLVLMIGWVSAKPLLESTAAPDTNSVSLAAPDAEPVLA